MKIGKTNAIFGGGVVYNFVPFVAPESFNDPRKYADFGCTVNLYEKFRIYKMTYPTADIAVEFSDAVESVVFTSYEIGQGAAIEIFETVSGVEISTLLTEAGTHTFASGSTKRYMIRRDTTIRTFIFPDSSVWAYCSIIGYLRGYINTENPYLKYIFFDKNTLTGIGLFRDTAITGILTINGGVTNILARGFSNCTNLTKVITGDSVSTITGGGAFMDCTSLQVADLGEGITSIGSDAFVRCTSLASIICRAYNPPTIVAFTFRFIPATTNFYVPHERVEAYKDATGWIAYASRIYSINDL